MLTITAPWWLWVLAAVGTEFIVGFLFNFARAIVQEVYRSRHAS